MFSNEKFLQKQNRVGFHIEICGGIASGKTSLAVLLKEIGINAVFENFKENPFWEKFYSDPVQYSFETELTFLLQHYHQIKSFSNSNSNFTCDFSLLLDLAYADVTLQSSKKESFLSVYDEILKELYVPDLLIYLTCKSETELNRIRKRGRSVESNITTDFLGSLNFSIKKRVMEVREKINVLTIDSENFDFANDGQVQEKILTLVRNSLPKSAYLV
jgi:deoxyadenosine/deoxycytidine kinase